MKDTDKNTSTPEGTVSVPADSASNSTVPVYAKIASVGSLVSAKVRAVGVARVSRPGGRRSPKRKLPDAD